MRALQKVKRYGSVTGVTIPRTILRYLAWYAGDSMMTERTDDGTLLVRRPTEDDVKRINHPDGYVLEHFAVLRLTQNGNTVNICIKRDFLIRLGWLPEDRVIIETLEDKSVRVRPGTTEDLNILLGPARMTAHPGAVRS